LHEDETEDGWKKAERKRKGKGRRREGRETEKW
jgi:hypothetical protein